MSKLRERCSRIKLFLSDVDGVLTDAGMYYSEAGDELKKFSTLDGGGFLLLKLVGVQTGLLTSENTRMVERRAKKLKIDHVVQGAGVKRDKLDKLLGAIDMTVEEVAYIGDDINDIAVLQSVGVSATVTGNCLPETVSCDYVTERRGGSGAVREFAEWLLRQRGQYRQALSSYLEGLDR